MTIKISSKRPDDDLNGLEAIVDALVDNPHEPVIAVVMLRPLRATREFEQDSDGEIPTVRFVHIEPLADDAAKAARDLLMAARAKRNGGGDGTLFDVDGQGPEQVGPVSERIADAWLDDGKAKG